LRPAAIHRKKNGFPVKKEKAGEVHPKIDAGTQKSRVKEEEIKVC